MWKNESNGTAPQRMTEALQDYEEAVREFSTSAAEFLKYMPLLDKAREAYERATTASTHLRDILDKGDETLHKFMAQMQETITFTQESMLGKVNPEETAAKAAEEKADAAHA